MEFQTFCRVFLGQCRKILLDQSVSFRHLVHAPVQITKKLSKTNESGAWKRVWAQTENDLSQALIAVVEKFWIVHDRPDVSANHKVQQHFLNLSMRHRRNQQIRSYSTSLRSIVPSVYSKCLLWRLEQKISLGSLRNQLSVAARQ